MDRATTKACRPSGFGQPFKQVSGKSTLVMERCNTTTRDLLLTFIPPDAQ
jgi:hypothetical protein